MMLDKLPVSESELASFVEDALDTLGWQWIHIRPARVLRQGKETYETPYSGNKGFLDYLAIRSSRLLVFELKSEKGKLSPEQQEWYNLWEECQRTIIIQPLEIKGNKVDMKLKKKTEILTIPELYLWKPSDWQKIIEILR